MRLSTAIHEQTDDRYLIWRFCDALHRIGKAKGRLFSIMTAGTLASIKVYAVAIVYFCMEGSIRSVIDFSEEDEDQAARFRPLGDASGWTAMAVFTVMTVTVLFLKVVREGEYLKLKSICLKWMEENKERQKPKFLNKWYLQVNDILDAHQSQLLFPKSIISRKLTALKIQQSSGFKSRHPTYKKDKKLKKTFKCIQKELDEAISTKKYFHRLIEGQKSFKRQGYFKLTAALMMGIVLPIFLLIVGIFSFVGEVGLTKEIFHDRKGLSETGHVGEWFFNGIEIISIALFLHFSKMIQEGDFVRTRQIYAKYLTKLKHKKRYVEYNRLCTIGNQAISQIDRSYFALPEEYKFKKHEKEMC